MKKRELVWAMSMVFYSMVRMGVSLALVQLGGYGTAFLIQAVELPLSNTSKLAAVMIGLTIIYLTFDLINWVWSSEFYDHLFGGKDEQQSQN